jgi:hypothetical protein
LEIGDVSEYSGGLLTQEFKQKLRKLERATKTAPSAVVLDDSTYH